MRQAVQEAQCAGEREHRERFRETHSKLVNQTAWLPSTTCGEVKGKTDDASIGSLDEVLAILGTSVKKDQESYERPVFICVVRFCGQFSGTTFQPCPFRACRGEVWGGVWGTVIRETLIISNFTRGQM